MIGNSILFGLAPLQSETCCVYDRILLLLRSTDFALKNDIFSRNTIVFYAKHEAH